MAGETLTGGFDLSAVQCGRQSIPREKRTFMSARVGAHGGQSGEIAEPVEVRRDFAGKQQMKAFAKGSRLRLRSATDSFGHEGRGRQGNSAALAFEGGIFHELIFGDAQLGHDRVATHPVDGMGAMCGVGKRAAVTGPPPVIQDNVLIELAQIVVHRRWHEPPPRR